MAATDEGVPADADYLVTGDKMVGGDNRRLDAASCVDIMPSMVVEAVGGLRQHRRCGFGMRLDLGRYWRS
jgi:hypothetical protein